MSETKGVYQLLKVGTDAEFFLQNKAGDPVPVVGLLGGTKHDPKPVPELGEGFAVQEDNVMAEVNIPAAATSAAFVQDCEKIKAHLASVMASRDLDIDISGSRFFIPSQLDSLQAQTFGCEPDLNAHKQAENVIDRGNLMLTKHGLRTAAAHVHISFTVDGKFPNNNIEREPVVFMCDYVYGLASVLLDDDTFRRQLYGKAGSFRAKNYGIESRVMSNWWMRTPEYQEWVFTSADWMMKQIPYYMAKKKFSRDYLNNIEIIINNHQKKPAWNWIEDMGIPMPASFYDGEFYKSVSGQRANKKAQIPAGGTFTQWLRQPVEEQVLIDAAALGEAPVTLNQAAEAQIAAIMPTRTIRIR